ncbi:hypothetical protein [Georgenia alba]|uniref:PKD domain-containing protein n=1 Tax=Georgenia alba TaxID=2233858 RepID=A0ABW2Q3Q3_9MICO
MIDLLDRQTQTIQQYADQSESDGVGSPPASEPAGSGDIVSEELDPNALCTELSGRPGSLGMMHVGLCTGGRDGGPQIASELAEIPEPEPEPEAEEPEPEPEPVVVTAEDFARLPIDPGGLTVQPDRGWVMVNIETIAYTGAAEQTFDIELLGTPVRVHAVPLDYTWDYGDGTVFTTDDPGAPYPNHTVHHTYTDATDEGGPAVTRQITLTTQWVGEFSVAGGPWQPVAGVATTTQTTDPFEVRQYDTSLVAGDRA